MQIKNSRRARTVSSFSLVERLGSLMQSAYFFMSSLSGSVRLDSFFSRSKISRSSLLFVLLLIHTGIVLGGLPVCDRTKIARMQSVRLRQVEGTSIWIGPERADKPLELEVRKLRLCGFASRTSLSTAINQCGRAFPVRELYASRFATCVALFCCILKVADCLRVSRAV